MVPNKSLTNNLKPISSIVEEAKADLRRREDTHKRILVEISLTTENLNKLFADFEKTIEEQKKAIEEHKSMTAV